MKTRKTRVLPVSPLPLPPPRELTDAQLHARALELPARRRAPEDEASIEELAEALALPWAREEPAAAPARRIVRRPAVAAMSRRLSLAQAHLDDLLFGLAAGLRDAGGEALAGRLVADRRARTPGRWRQAARAAAARRRGAERRPTVHPPHGRPASAAVRLVQMRPLRGRAPLHARAGLLRRGGSAAALQRLLRALRSEQPAEADATAEELMTRRAGRRGVQPPRRPCPTAGGTRQRSQRMLQNDRTSAKDLSDGVPVPVVDVAAAEERGGRHVVRALWLAVALLTGCGGGSRCVVTGYAPTLIAGRLVVVEAQRCAEVEQ